MVRLLSSLPVGTKVVDPATTYYGTPIVWVIAGHSHYSINTSVLLSERVIGFKAIDAKEPNYVGRPDRQMYGNNRYRDSNIRAWLNSTSKTSGGWYSPTHEYDTPPTKAYVKSMDNPYSDEAGFLRDFSSAMKSSMPPVSVKVGKNTVYEGGGTEFIEDKVFLPSLVEVNSWSPQDGALSVEGKVFDLFKGTNTGASNSRVAYATQKALDNSSAHGGYTTSTPVLWWLRSPRVSVDYNTMLIDSQGNYAVSNCYNGSVGIRPAVHIYYDTTVSDTPDANGVYELVFSYIDAPPSGEELGSSYTGSNLVEYTVYHYPPGSTATEKVNGVVFNTRSLVNGAPMSVSIPSDKWVSVPYGKFRDNSGARNIITIEVSTGEVYTYPLTKTLSTNAKTDEVVMAVNDMSNTAMPSHKKKLVDAIGNKATIGGTGSLEDIAKAVSGISAGSFDRSSSQTIRSSSSMAAFALTSGTSAMNMFYFSVDVSALGFIPDSISAYTIIDGYPYVTRWERTPFPDRANVVVPNVGSTFYVPYNEGVINIPISNNMQDSNLQVLITGRVN